MGLETGTYISDLVSTNPLGSDAKSTADDHLRLIKSCIKATYPNVSGAVTPTHTELNYVDGVTSAIQTQIDSKQATLVSGTNIKTINSASLLGSGDVAVQPTLVSGTNIKTINSTSLLGSGDITISANPSGVSGAIQFSAGSAFASDAANLFWDDTNNRLGIGTNAPSGKLQINDSTSSLEFNVSNSFDYGEIKTNKNLLIFSAGGNSMLRVFSTGTQIGYISGTPSAQLSIKGSGSTSATTSLLVQNSGGSELLKVDDSGQVYVNTQIFAKNTAFGAWAQINTFNNNLSLVGYANASQDHVWQSSVSFNSANFRQTANGFGFQIGDLPTINASAVVDITSTTKGFLPPRMTTTQKNAIATPAAGLVVYDSTTNKLCCYNGSTWNDLF